MSGAREAGEALAQAAGSLADVWRGARVEVEPSVFPAALDGIVASFVGAVGEGLVAGRAPEDAWARTEGVVRVDPGAGATRAAFAAETRVLGEVLATACGALRAPPEVHDVAARAVEALRQALDRLLAGEPPPPGVLVVRLLSGFRPRAAGPR